MTHTQTTTQTTHTQAQDSSMTQAQNMTHTGPKMYRLAKDGVYQVQPFGPLLTLAQAQKYQADMLLGGFDVLILNTKAV